MSRDPRPPLTAAERLARHIAGEILGGPLDEGSMLATEAEMSVRYGVSRRTVRGALALLASWGVVGVRRGRHGGPEVRRPDAHALGWFFGITLQFDGVTWADLFRTRRSIDAMLVEFAARDMTDELVIDLAEAVSGMRANIADTAAYTTYGDRFYEALAAASGNRTLDVLIGAFRAVSDELMTRIDQPERWREHSIVHRSKIFRAVASRDEDEARAAMAAYWDALESWYQDHRAELLASAIEFIPLRTTTAAPAEREAR